MSPHLRNAELFHLIDGIIVFLQMLSTLKRTCCGNLNVRHAPSQQVFSVHLLHGHTLPVFSPLINRIAHDALLKFNPRSSQQTAAATRPYRGLVFDRHASASCTRCVNLPDLDQDCWLATCQTDEMGCLTA